MQLRGANPEPRLCSSAKQGQGNHNRGSRGGSWQCKGRAYEVRDILARERDEGETEKTDLESEAVEVSQ
jgi:hypothetical protein